MLHRLTASAQPRERPRTQDPGAWCSRPTRELASQIGDSFRTYGQHTGLRHAVVYGGVGQNPQVARLRQRRRHPRRHAGPAARPDEPGLRRSAQRRNARCSTKPTRCSTWASSTTCGGSSPRVPAPAADADVLGHDAAARFASWPTEWLRDPAHVQVAPVATPAERSSNRSTSSSSGNKPQLLAHLLQDQAAHAGDRLHPHQARRRQASCKQLATSRHSRRGDPRQQEPERPRSGRWRSFKSTSAAGAGGHRHRRPRHRHRRHLARRQLRPAARVAETYVHRIGRTGRAGATGIAVSFCGARRAVRCCGRSSA